MFDAKIFKVASNSFEMLVRRGLRLFAPLTRPQVFQTGRLSFPPKVSSLCRILYSPFSFGPHFGRFVSSIFICYIVATLGYLVGIYPKVRLDPPFRGGGGVAWGIRPT